MNVLAQYRPYYGTRSEDRYEETNRPITPGEYRSVLDHAREVGLEGVEYDPGMAGEG